MRKTHIILTVSLLFFIVLIGGKSAAANGNENSGAVVNASDMVDTSDLQDAYQEWEGSYTGPEHSNIYTETEPFPEDVDTSVGWVEGVGQEYVIVEDSGSGGNGGNGGNHHNDRHHYYRCIGDRCLRGSSLMNRNDECSSDADCQPPPSSYGCRQCRGESCIAIRSETPCSSDCSFDSHCTSPTSGTNGTTSCPRGDNCYSCNRSTGECYRNYNGVYAGSRLCERYCSVSGDGSSDNNGNGYTSPTTTLPQCEINKFELPRRAWVDIETTASWSTNNCTTAQITCISDDCIEGVEDLSGSVNPGFDQSKNFTIKAPGTYRYELVACDGPIPPDPHNDEKCDIYEDVLGTGGTGDPYIEIEALHLPWWQEVIPSNLQGFLKGLIKFN